MTRVGMFQLLFSCPRRCMDCEPLTHSQARTCPSIGCTYGSRSTNPLRAEPLMILSQIKVRPKSMCTCTISTHNIQSIITPHKVQDYDTMLRYPRTRLHLRTLWCLDDRNLLKSTTLSLRCPCLLVLRGQGELKNVDRHGREPYEEVIARERHLALHRHHLKRNAEGLSMMTTVRKHIELLVNSVSSEGAQRRPLFISEANGDVHPGFRNVLPYYTSTNGTDVQVGCSSSHAERLRPSHCIRTPRFNPILNPFHLQRLRIGRLGEIP